MSITNQFRFIGNVVKDPEIKDVKDDKKVANVTIAVNKVKKEEKADFFRITLFGKSAELASQYVKKGQKIAVDGRIVNTTWEKDGETKYGTDYYGSGFEIVNWGKDESFKQESEPLPSDESVPF